MKLKTPAFITKLIEDDRIHPARDWFIVLGTMCVLVVLSLVWNIVLFVQFQNAKAASQGSTGGHAVSTKAISDVQDIFKARAAERANYQNSYQFIDPSK